MVGLARDLTKIILMVAVHPCVGTLYLISNGIKMVHVKIFVPVGIRVALVETYNGVDLHFAHACAKS